MKRKAKALVSEYKNELLAARTLYVSLDRADNVIEGGAPLQHRQPTASRFWVGRIPLRCSQRVRGNFSCAVANAKSERL